MDDRPAFSIGVVSQRTGVPADTIRAWERRYGVAVPKRTPGGHRLYSERDIETLRWLRERVSGGMPISNAVALRANLAESQDRPLLGGRPVETLAVALENALLAFDGERAEMVLSEAFALHGVVRCCLDVIRPAMVQIGEGWHRGTVSVAQEHYATHVVTAKVHQLYALHISTAFGPPVLLACAPGEYHELGLAILTLFLAWRGHNALNLGADVPPDAILEAVDRVKPLLVGFSAGTRLTLRRAVEVAQQLLRLPDAPSVGFGGSVFESHPELISELPGVYLGGNAQDGANAISTLLANLTRAVVAD